MDDVKTLTERIEDEKDDLKRMGVNDDSYPESWTPRSAPRASTSSAPAEAVAMAIDAYIASLSDDEFRALVERARGH